MGTSTINAQNIGGLRSEYKTYEQQKCFVAHSTEASWRDDLLSACAEVLPKFNLEPWYASFYSEDYQPAGTVHFDPTKPLRDKVVQLIAIYPVGWIRTGNGACRVTFSLNWGWLLPSTGLHCFYVTPATKLYLCPNAWKAWI
jgi:hypothetical protein